MPVIAVTGATGFVGTALVGRLARTPGIELRLLVRDAGSRSLPETLSAHTVVEGDLDDHSALDALVTGSDAVIHAAAAIAGNRRADFDRANVAGTRRLADAVCRHAADTHWIQISSLAARQPGLSWYAQSKRAAEEIVRSRIRRWTLLRPPAVYGPTDPALADFWRLLANGWLIRLGPAHARFSLLHVDDLAAAAAAALARGPCRDVVALAGPQPPGGWSWSHLARTAADVRGGPVRTVALPAPLLRGVARASLALGRMRGRPAVLSPGKARELLHPDWVCDTLEAEQRVGQDAVTPLEQAIGTLPGWTNT